MKRKVLVCLLSVLLLLSLAGCGSTEQDTEPNDSQPSGEVEQQPDEASGPPRCKQACCAEQGGHMDITG